MNNLGPYITGGLIFIGILTFRRRSRPRGGRSVSSPVSARSIPRPSRTMNLRDAGYLVGYWYGRAKSARINLRHGVSEGYRVGVYTSHVMSQLIEQEVDDEPDYAPPEISARSETAETIPELDILEMVRAIAGDAMKTPALKLLSGYSGRRHARYSVMWDQLKAAMGEKPNDPRT